MQINLISNYLFFILKLSINAIRIIDYYFHKNN